MSIVSGAIVHRCTVSHPGTSTQNDMGEVIPGTPTTSSISCLFFQPKAVLVDLSSGFNIKKNVQLLTLSPVSVGDTITSAHTGYTGPYLVKSCVPSYMFGELDHYESELETVV